MHFLQLNFGKGQILSADLRDLARSDPPYENGEQLLHVRYSNGCGLIVIYLANQSTAKKPTPNRQAFFANL